MRAENSRQDQRRQIRYRAWVSLGEPPQLHECMLEDISINGASIKLPPSVDLPKQFKLLLSQTGIPRRICEIIWRKESDVGVKFLEEKILENSRTTSLETLEA